MLYFRRLVCQCTALPLDGGQCCMLLTRFIPTLLVLLLAFRAGGAEDLPVLRTVQDVRALSNEEAARGYPIQVRGVITFSGNARGLHFVADSTGGIYLSIAGSPVP